MYKIYFAGDLFDQKHLVGNALLAKNIEKLSGGKYMCDLPQDCKGIECCGDSTQIRNEHIAAIVDSDLLILNFDGTDLDSGTAIELILAKMLDMPVVLLRSDIRTGGYWSGQDWNLMASGFPRSVEVKVSAIEMYHKLGLEEFQSEIARLVVNALDKVLDIPSLVGSYDELLSIYKNFVKMCGGGLEKTITPEFLRELLAKKIEKGLYQVGDVSTHVSSNNISTKAT